MIEGKETSYWMSLPSQRQDPGCHYMSFDSLCRAQHHGQSRRICLFWQYHQRRHSVPVEIWGCLNKRKSNQSIKPLLLLSIFPLNPTILCVPLQPTMFISVKIQIFIRTNPPTDTSRDPFSSLLIFILFFAWVVVEIFGCLPWYEAKYTLTSILSNSLII